MIVSSMFSLDFLGASHDSSGLAEGLYVCEGVVGRKVGVPYSDTTKTRLLNEHFTWKR